MTVIYIYELLLSRPNNVHTIFLFLSLTSYHIYHILHLFLCVLFLSQVCAICYQLFSTWIGIIVIYFAGHLTPRSDVYSFGVVLLELLTGRKSLDKLRPAREQNLTEWALPLLKEKKKVQNIIDPRLEGHYPEKGFHKAAMLAYHCLNKNPKARPLMRDIVDSLEPLTTYSEVSIEKTLTIIGEVSEAELKKKDEKWLKDGVFILIMFIGRGFALTSCVC